MGAPRKKYEFRPKPPRVVLEPPVIPKYIAIRGGGAILVQNLTEEQILEVGDKWTKKLRKESIERKNDKGSQHLQGEV